MYINKKTFSIDIGYSDFYFIFLDHEIFIILNKINYRACEISLWILGVKFILLQLRYINWYESWDHLIFDQKFLLDWKVLIVVLQL
jgi:hypothetical protein